MPTDQKDPLKVIFGEIWTAVGELVKVVAPAAGARLQSTKPGRRATHAAVRLVTASAKKQVGRAIGEGSLILRLALLIETLAWPGTVILAMVCNTLALYHVMIAKAITFDLLIREWTFTLAVPMFVWFLLIFVVQNLMLIRLGIIGGLSGASVGLATGLHFKDKGVAEAFTDALGSSGRFFSWTVFNITTKVSNENWWSDAVFFLVVVTPFFLAPVHPLLLMIPSAIDIAGIWKIQSSRGNNRTIEGYIVTESSGGKEVEYPSLNHNPATGMWEHKKGHKPALPVAQQWALSVLTAFIVFTVGLSYLGLIVRYHNIREGEKVESTIAKKEYRLKKGINQSIGQLEAEVATVNPDLAVRDSLERYRDQLLAIEPPDNANEMDAFYRRQDDQVRGVDDQLAKIESAPTLRARLVSLNSEIDRLRAIDFAAKRDSIAEAVTDSVSDNATGDMSGVIPGAKLKVSWDTNRGMPPPIVDKVTVKAINLWDWIHWHPLLVVGVSIVCAIIGAKRRNSKARLIWWVVSVLIFMIAFDEHGWYMDVGYVVLSLFLFGLLKKEVAPATA